MLGSDFILRRLPFFAALFVVPNLAWAGSIRGWSDLREFVSGDSKKTLTEVVRGLGGEFQKNYALVYDSRSTMGASLRFPRVISMSSDGRTLVAYAGDPSMKGGNLVEVIHLDEETGRYTFKVLEFDEGGVFRRLDENPESCRACHSALHGIGWNRPIWDGYPTWPGFYGSAHNARIQRPKMIGDEARFVEGGTSLIPTPEFEKSGFQEFLKNAVNSERYSHLENLRGLYQISLESLAAKNMHLTDIVFDRYYESLSKTLVRLPTDESKIVIPTEEELRRYTRAGLERQAKHLQKIHQKLGDERTRALYAEVPPITTGPFDHGKISAGALSDWQQTPRIMDFTYPGIDNGRRELRELIGVGLSHGFAIEDFSPAFDTGTLGIDRAYAGSIDHPLYHFHREKERFRCESLVLPPN
jgi:hypothetical protein